VNLVGGLGAQTAYVRNMASKFAREAAAALLRWSRAASDQSQTIGLVEKAADIKDRIGELLPPETDMSPLAPDVQSERLREP